MTFDLKTLTLPLASLVVLFGLTACETIEGAGQDIEKAGEEISETSREVAD